MPVNSSYSYVPQQEDPKHAVVFLLDTYLRNNPESWIIEVSEGNLVTTDAPNVQRSQKICCGRMIVHKLEIGKAGTEIDDFICRSGRSFLVYPLTPTFSSSLRSDRQKRKKIIISLKVSIRKNLSNRPQNVRKNKRKDSSLQFIERNWGTLSTKKTKRQRAKRQLHK